MTAKPQKIERLYAWIATEADGKEGVPAVTAPDGTVCPLVGADRARIESFREIARGALRLGDVVGVRLVCFDHLVEIERLADA
jgi:hypothetical protein